MDGLEELGDAVIGDFDRFDGGLYVSGMSDHVSVGNVNSAKFVVAAFQ